MRDADRPRGDARAHGPRRRGVPRRPEGALAAPPPAGRLRRDAVVPAAARRRAAALTGRGRDRRDARRRDRLLRPAGARWADDLLTRSTSSPRLFPDALPSWETAGGADVGRRGRARPSPRVPGGDRRGRQPVRGVRRRRRRSRPRQRDGGRVVVPELGRDRAARRPRASPTTATSSRLASRRSSASTRAAPRSTGPCAGSASAATPPSPLTPSGAPADAPLGARPARRWRRCSCPTSATASATTPACAGFRVIGIDVVAPIFERI